jgi:hypothetical protein
MKRERIQIFVCALLAAATFSACGSSGAGSTSAVSVSDTKAGDTKTADNASDTKASGSDKGITDDERAAMLKSVKSGGASDEIAECVTDGLAKGLSRDEFNAVTKAKKQEDVPKPVADKANTIAMDCALSTADAPAVAAAPAETTIAAPAQSVGTRSAPVALGTAATLDNNYEITVNSYTPNSSAAVAAMNEFSEKPAPGMQYVLMNMKVTNNGGETDKRIPGYDLPIKALSVSGKAYENSDCLAATPEPLDRFVDLFKGKSIEGNVCFLIADADATGLQMYIDVTTKDYSTLTYYFNLA